MGTSIIAPDREVARAAYTPVIEVKPNWADDWQIDPELSLDRGHAASAGHDLGELTVTRRYGRTRAPWDADFATVDPIDIAGWWLRVRLATPDGLQTIFVGQISGEARNIQGSNITASGVQTFMAYEPLRMLQRIDVDRSIWTVDGEEKTIGWVPGMNARDARQMLVGNRSADVAADGVYLYGGDQLWTHKDAVDYVLTRFADQSDAAGPSWWLGGQADLLAEITDTVNFGVTQKISEVLRALIPTRLGVDYKIVYLEGEGFEVHVFALTAEAVCFAGKTIPLNPNKVEIVASATPESDFVKITKTHDNRYDTLRVIGRRILVCCSLEGATVAEEQHGEDATATLVKKWHDDQETLYKAGTGDAADTMEEHAAARADDRFRMVYQQFGAPDDWGFNDGKAAPSFDATGELMVGVAADAQTTVRSTEPVLPLREGFDYSVDPPVDNTPDGHEADFMPPVVWIYDGDPEEGDARHVPIDTLGIGVSVPRNDWGAFLSASPNHLLAMNHWEEGDPEVADTDPAYDYDTLAATIAFHGDQRLTLEYTRPSASPGGGTMVIMDRNAELWYLAPDTIIGVAADGKFQRSGSTGRILRNDIDRMLLVMAGAIARYMGGRCRAAITIKGLLPWSPLIGHVLTVLEENGDSQTIQAPITSVEWKGGDQPTTTIRTGFAR